MTFRTLSSSLLSIPCALVLLTACGGSSPTSATGAGGAAPTSSSTSGSVTSAGGTGGGSSTTGTGGSGGSYDPGANNTWVQIPDIKLDLPAGYGGKLDRRFWCSFVWDDDAQRVLFYEGYGGDHGQTGGSIYANTLYSLTPEDQTVHLLHLTESWANPGYNSYTTNGAPVEPHPRHTYAGIHYAAGRKTVYLVSGACAHDVATCTIPDAWKYDLVADSWKPIAGPLPDKSLGGYGSSLVGLPGEDTLWYFSPRTDGSGWINLYSLDLNTDLWSSKINYGSDVAGLVRAVADPKRHQLLVWTSGANKLLTFNPTTQTMSPVAGVPSDFLGGGTMTYIPKYDRFFFYQPQTKEIWTYAPSTGTFEVVKHQDDPGKRVDNYLVYDPKLDVVVVFNIDREFWQLRYVP